GAHLRLCYARGADDIHRAFDRLEDYFAGRPARTTSPAPARPTPPSNQGLARRAGTALLRHGARVHIARTGPRIIAITGTQGKTVIKRTVAELLGRRLRVRANPSRTTPPSGYRSRSSGGSSTRAVPAVPHAIWRRPSGPRTPPGRPSTSWCWSWACGRRVT